LDATLGGRIGHGGQFFGGGAQRPAFASTRVKSNAMDILFLLIPLSVVLVLVIMVVFWWALHSGQFDHLDGEAERILDDDG
jgi:cbb3-type cytochrome oxidase maturation protein